jgi:hypothetical protein
LCLAARRSLARWFAACAGRPRRRGEGEDGGVRALLGAVGSLLGLGQPHLEERHLLRGSPLQVAKPEPGLRLGQRAGLLGMRALRLGMRARRLDLGDPLLARVLVAAGRVLALARGLLVVDAPAADVGQLGVRLGDEVVERAIDLARSGGAAERRRSRRGLGPRRRWIAVGPGQREKRLERQPLGVVRGQRPGVLGRRGALGRRRLCVLAGLTALRGEPGRLGRVGRLLVLARRASVGVDGHGPAMSTERAAL